MTKSLKMSGGGRVKNYTPQGFERYYEVPVYGFTLAEVLITLGIIGLVAAMTVPTLISNYQEKVLDTKYKKAKNILLNGYKLMTAKEHVFDIKDLSLFQCKDQACYANKHKEAFRISRDSLSSDIKTSMSQIYTRPGFIQGIDFGENFWEQVPYMFQTNDGITFILMAGNNGLNFYSDVNGSGKPNTVGKDFFLFALSDNIRLSDATSALITKETPSDYSPDGALSDIKTQEQCQSHAESLGPLCWSKGAIKWNDEVGCYMSNTKVNHYLYETIFDLYCS